MAAAGQGPTTGADKRRGLGYDYLHAAVDGHSRLAYVEVHPDEWGSTTGAFRTRAAQFFASRGAPVERVMTDNAFSYRHSGAFRMQLQTIGARHILIPSRRSQVNGKVERFNRTLLEEWAYVRLYRSNGARLQALERWMELYNSNRPHTALGGRPPTSRL